METAPITSHLVSMDADPFGTVDFDLGRAIQRRADETGLQARRNARMDRLRNKLMAKEVELNKAAAKRRVKRKMARASRKANR